MDPIKGAVAGAVGGAAGAYTMQRFQEWWQDLETRAAPKRRGGRKRCASSSAPR